MLTTTRVLLIASAMALFAAWHEACAAQVTLAWDAPTANTDGSPATNLTGFRIYYGTTRGTYDQVIDIVAGTQGTLRDLQGGQRYFLAVTARNADGQESALSDEIAWDAPTDGNPPTPLSLHAIAIMSGEPRAFTLSWIADAGNTYQVESSDDLLVWQPAPSAAGADEQSARTVLAQGLVSYRDVTAGDARRRFYRVRATTP